MIIREAVVERRSDVQAEAPDAVIEAQAQIGGKTESAGIAPLLFSRDIVRGHSYEEFIAADDAGDETRYKALRVIRDILGMEDGGADHPLEAVQQKVLETGQGGAVGEGDRDTYHLLAAAQLRDGRLSVFPVRSSLSGASVPKPLCSIPEPAVRL